MNFLKERLEWVREPEQFEITAEQVVIRTAPGTDLWQNTGYGFVHDNAPMLLTRIDAPFTFSVRTDFEYKVRFDQCGLIVWRDSENWIKLSTEYENEAFSHLGSVVTNHGFSDWAVQRVPSTNCCAYYRISGAGSDFRLEASEDGRDYEMIRIAHLDGADRGVCLGIYACSPGNSTFMATFSELEVQDPIWAKEE